MRIILDGVLAPDPERNRIQWGPWIRILIRIQEGINDLQYIENSQHFLKCLMLSSRDR